MTWGYIVWRAAPLFLVIMLVSYSAGDGWRAIPSALVAWGTILLAFATFTLIRHSREQEDQRRKDDQAREKRDREERLLNEIIEWAIDVAKCGKRADLSDLLHIADDKQKSFLPIRMTEAALNIGLMEGRNEYISTIALNFGQELQEHADILIDCLEAYKELLETESKDVPIAPESIEKLESQDRQLLTLVSNVIKNTCKFKTITKQKQQESMSNEDKTTGNNEPTLKDIEKHLKRQDTQTKRMVYFAGAAFGASIILVAVSLWIGRLVLSATAFFWQYVLLLAVGFGFMCWCWWKLSKVK